MKGDSSSRDERCRTRSFTHCGIACSSLSFGGPWWIAAGLDSGSRRSLNRFCVLSAVFFVIIVKTITYVYLIMHLPLSLYLRSLTPAQSVVLNETLLGDSCHIESPDVSRLWGVLNYSAYVEFNPLIGIRRSDRSSDPILDPWRSQFSSNLDNKEILHLFFNGGCIPNESK